MINILPIILFTMFDAIYLKTTFPIFDNQVKIIQGTSINMKILPTIICYIALLLGLYRFIIYSDKPNNTKIIDSLILGFVIYAVYETTNAAIFDKWELKSVLIDTTWGTILFGLVTFITLNVNPINIF
jgi:uncharacterized membrane protein